MFNNGADIQSKGINGLTPILFAADGICRGWSKKELKECTEKLVKNISYLLDGCEPGYGFGGVFSDVDNDGDLDLYLINDFGE